MILIARYWKYSVILILTILLLAAAAGWYNAINKIKLIKSDHALKIASLDLQHANQARAIEQKGIENVVKAINESKEREQVIIADAASARAAVNSLSDTIDKLSATAASDASFRVEYSRTTGNLLKECSGQYIAMAETADRISNDLRAIQQASR